MFTSLSARLHRALRHTGPASAHRQRGAIAVLAAVVLTVVFAAAGAAVDFGRAYFLQVKLQQAAESAVLAAGADGQFRTEAQLKATAARYLAANSIPVGLASVDTAGAYNEDTRIFRIDLTGTISTSFLSLLGRDKLIVKSSASATKKTPGPLDIVLVLDQTTSMNNRLSDIEKVGVVLPANAKRIDAVKLVATNLLNDLKVSDAVLFGVVPFGLYTRFQTVPLSSAPAWMGATSTVTSATWGGCIGVRPVELGTDYLLTISDPELVKYPMMTCTGATMLPLKQISVAANYNAVLNKISVIGGQSSSFLPSGLVWGWNLLTDTAPFTEARSSTYMENVGGRKVLILLSDAGNNAVPYSGADGKRTGGFGALADAARKVPVSEGSPSEKLQRALCENIKADGIEIFTILYGLDDAEGLIRDNTIETMKKCASSSAGTDDHFVHAVNVQQLRSAFFNITERITNVRLVN